MKRKAILSMLKQNVEIWTGINLWQIKNCFPTPKRYFGLKKSLKKLKSQISDKENLFPISRLYPCFPDSKSAAGNSYSGYFWQDLYVAQRIFENKPVRHIDIGSRVDGFIAHIASFRHIDVLDVRPLNNVIPNISFIQCDAMDKNKMELNCTDSISCLHALEHFGLGRYGDPICYEGHLIGLRNITTMLKPKGKFYLSVPVGIQRIEFHAHRVFSLAYLLSILQDDYEIDNFSYFDDEGNFHPNSKITEEDVRNNLGCKIMGLAIFELTKRENILD